MEKKIIELIRQNKIPEANELYEKLLVEKYGITDEVFDSENEEFRNQVCQIWISLVSEAFGKKAMQEFIDDLIKGLGLNKRGGKR